MTTARCSTSVRFSEQHASNRSLFSAEIDPRDHLLQQAALRDEVQEDIYKLIRRYEQATGLSVTKLEYDRREGRVILEALPL
jgi:hypothetical protein